MVRKQMKRILFIVFCITPCISHAFDVSHFFHAQFAPEEPRFEKPHLTSLSARAAFGATRKKNDACGIPITADCDDRYSMQAFVFDLSHNFCRGFFLTATLPFYHFKITEKPLHKEFWSASNMCFTGGWALNYEGCEELDFIDATIETGFVAATAEKPWNAWGIPLRGAVSCGLFDWVTGLLRLTTSYVDYPASLGILIAVKRKRLCPGHVKFCRSGPWTPSILPYPMTAHALHIPFYPKQNSFLTTS